MTGHVLAVPEAAETGLVAEARRLADRLSDTRDGDVAVVAVAMDGVVDADDLTAGHADEVCALSREDGRFETGAAGIEARVDALETLVTEGDPRAVLLPATPDGDEIAARLGDAVRGAALVDGLLRIRDGDLAGGRPAYDGRAFEAYEFERAPVVASLALDGLGGPDTVPDDEPERTARTVSVADESRVERLDAVEIPEQDISRAPTVVAGGMGLEDAADFELIEDIADALGGTLAASRPPVDAGWLPYDRQVGVTGKPVDADLYVACAISGDPYHMEAVEADTLVAVNTDPEARIFEFADLGIVGDVYEYGPAIAEAIRAVGDDGGETAFDPETAAAAGEGKR
jgi:electron transfer flavoprotein alpha subunit